MPRDDLFAVGTIIAGRYEILRVLGEGSFGRTLLAHDRELAREVALKLLSSQSSSDWKARELFEREAMVLRSLRHHGVPEVHALLREEVGGVQVEMLVMEYVEGKSLAEVIDARTELDAADSLSLFLELLNVLDYLHGRVPPVLHRDIKPANILMRPDRIPVLVDFGSVRHLFLGPEETGSTVVGTYGYMPYEQYMGQASARSDLYGLAATFLHLLTGRPPRDFMSGDGHIEVPLPLPGDPRLGPVIARLLKPAPSERFASADEVRRALLAPMPVVVPAPQGVTRKASAAVPEHVAVETVPHPVFLVPVPRPFDATASELFQQVAPGSLDYLDTSARPSDHAGLGDWLALVLVSVGTIGVYPLIFVGMAKARRRRLKRFFEYGIPANAEILSIQSELIAFSQKMARVGYQFLVDGKLRRDTDLVLPMVADRIRVGETISILYMPGWEHDSVILP